MSNGNLIYSTGGHLAYGTGDHLVYSAPYKTMHLITQGTMSFEYYNGSEWVSFSYTPGTIGLTATDFLPATGYYQAGFTSGDKTILAQCWPDDSTPRNSWSKWMWYLRISLTSQHLVWIQDMGNDTNDATNPPYPLTGTAYYISPFSSSNYNNGGSSKRNGVGLSSVSASIP